MNWLENSKSLTTPWKQRVGSKRPWRFGDVSQWNNQPRRLAQTQSSFANTYLYFVLSNSLLYIYSPLYFKVFFHFLRILSLSLCLSHIHTFIGFGIDFALDSRSLFSANQLGLSTTLFPQVKWIILFLYLASLVSKEKYSLWENPLNKIESFCCVFSTKTASAGLMLMWALLAFCCLGLYSKGSFLFFEFWRVAHLQFGDWWVGSWLELLLSKVKYVCGVVFFFYFVCVCLFEGSYSVSHTMLFGNGFGIEFGYLFVDYGFFAFLKFWFFWANDNMVVVIESFFVSMLLMVRT